MMNYYRLSMYKLDSSLSQVLELAMRILWQIVSIQRHPADKTLQVNLCADSNPLLQDENKISHPCSS